MQYPVARTEAVMDGQMIRTYVSVEGAKGFTLPDLTLREARDVAEALFKHLGGEAPCLPADGDTPPPTISVKREFEEVYA